MQQTLLDAIAERKQAIADARTSYEAAIRLAHSAGCTGRELAGAANTSMTQIWRILNVKEAPDER